jgi:hypothetical protein
VGVSASIHGLLEPVSAYDRERPQHQDELREKFEIEFRDALLVVVCIVAAAALCGWCYWLGLPRVYE